MIIAAGGWSASNAQPDPATHLRALPSINHDRVDWGRVQRTVLRIQENIGYSYGETIHDLRHRLVVVPPERHLDQRRVSCLLSVSEDDAHIRDRVDEFGNMVFDVRVGKVESRIDFEAWILVERRYDAEPHRWTGDVNELLEPTSLTEPTAALSRAAREISAGSERGPELAKKIGLWVHENMSFAHDVTTIRTTAAEALAFGFGVCQDYAHIMIALCRLCGLPARYVSGHLPGEGGTHAWVEVLVGGDAGKYAVYPFDPSRGRQPGMSYATIAVGRDYGDVAPTSGTFLASSTGKLSIRRRVDVAEVEYS